MGTPLNEIDAERNRQIANGHGVDHDDEHADGSLVYAAIAYALVATDDGDTQLTVRSPSAAIKLSPSLLADSVWPWERPAYPPNRNSKNGRKRLVQAAALLVAEIERLDRVDAEEQFADP